MRHTIERRRGSDRNQRLEHVAAAAKNVTVAKGKLKAKVKITNTLNNVAQNFKVKF